jgi:hypothetical protein
MLTAHYAKVRSILTQPFPGIFKEIAAFYE